MMLAGDDDGDDGVGDDDGEQGERAPAPGKPQPGDCSAPRG